MRLELDERPTPDHLDVELSGSTVLVSHPDVDPLNHLHAWGVDRAYNAPGRTAAVPIRALSDLVSVPCELRASGDLAALISLAQHQTDEPARLTFERSGLRLDWFDSDGVLQVWTLSSESIPALLGSQLVFTATLDAWEHITAHSRLPVNVARASMNPDGFIEITAFMPQLVESAPLDRLFRLSGNRFGCPASAYQDVLTTPGFTWNGPPPPTAGFRRTVPSWAMTSHVAAGAGEIADAIETVQAAAVVWDSGLGRRMAVLAAIEQLELWPALVVCHPWGLWLWVRHLELAGRTPSLTDDRGDARLATYRDLPHIRFSDPSIVVFDEFTSPLTSAAVPALRHLDVLRDTPRIGVADSLPSSDEGLVSALGLLRPAEFETAQPLAWRYPQNPSQRLRRHVDSFVVARRLGDPDVDVTTPLRRSSVAVVASPPELSVAIDELLTAVSSPEEIAHAVTFTLSSGTATCVSPKLAEASSRLRSAAERGLRAAAWTRFERTANILSRLVKPWPCTVTDTFATSDTILTVLVGDTPSVPEGIEEFVVIDIPTAFSHLDRGDMAEPPRKTTVLHIPRSLDDTAAVAAVRGEPLDEADWALALADLRLRSHRQS